MENFWTKLPKPFTVLAPMDDVTDNVFRQVVLSAGRPDVFFTEFSNADGLVHGANGIPLRKLSKRVLGRDLLGVIAFQKS
ncbi:MAG: tRNA-dihydrouridine synthase [Candidatus Woesebacteria bacterium GW2011_GWA1_40_43]|uniref:tRNA-dihydrouridine synthase n=1 Tax=Candidatus Woesebacteria bacterium GW2011_GWA1_40_43 TaxID=1618553 RepID=A0A0G0SDF8_9BACT|nr:MAG: tRNA-dihydrouridine synthase [Candidatus Woesebacteria bacterium GW2011_GWA1_40_43]